MINPTSVIGASVRLGENVSVGPFCFLDGDIDIGSGTRLAAGITLTGSVRIGRDCHLESGVCLSEGPAPSAAGVIIGDRVWIGACSVLSNTVTIGSGSCILAGTLVTRRVPPNAIVQGSPASIIGYVDTPNLGHAQTDAAAFLSETTGPQQTSVPGVLLYRFPRIKDLRGDLVVGEFEQSAPFRPKRYFVVFDVPSAETRGEHAHKVCEQFLICVHGTVSIVVDDGRHREEHVLSSPKLGLYVPGMIWGLQYKYSRDGVLLVFASHYYDPDDYIRDYSEFLREKGIG
jgi:acetyltransferase-like isoleucine patch superfamily enzyme/dTDP-4-dehydrorhamnose 3,5-epimerase-like enzyme